METGRDFEASVDLEEEKEASACWVWTVGVAASEIHVVGAVLGGSEAWEVLWGDPWDQVTQEQEQKEQRGLWVQYFHPVFPLHFRQTPLYLLLDPGHCSWIH